MDVKVCDALDVNFVRSKSKVHLLRIQINVCSDGCVCLSVDSLTRWKPDDEIGPNDLLESLGHGDWEHSQFGVRNRFEPLTLFAASNILIDEGVHE